MSKNIEWPDLPNGDSQKELELFKAKLEIIKAEYRVHLSEVEEQKKAEIARETASHQAEIAKIAAEEAARIAEEAATHSANLAREAAEYAADVSRETADFANEYATLQEVYKGYVEVAKGEIDRSLQRADFVQKVAAAIGTAHAAILALSFAADQTRLPISGLAPAIFLGLSFFLATAYVAYFSSPNDIEAEPSDGSLRGNQDSRRDTFIDWAKESVLRRKYLLQCAVVSLAISVIFLPSPYLVELNQLILWIGVVIGVVLVFALPLLVSHLLKD